jgi:1-acyl-sn-glycerol-3-phosphate acyltransferase
MFGVKKTGFEQMPESGATLVCANHQSNLDPILVGCLCRRRLNFLAKKSLFKYPPLSWLIHFLDAIPLAKEGLSAEGIKETLRRLKREEAVLMFPEGARTFTNRMTPLLPGFITLVKRTKPILVPVGIAGAFEAWPRTRLFPIPGPRIRVVMGQPILAADYENLSEEQLTTLLDQRIRDCVGTAQRQLGREPNP